MIQVGFPVVCHTGIWRICPTESAIFTKWDLPLEIVPVAENFNCPIMYGSKRGNIKTDNIKVEKLQPILHQVIVAKRLGWYMVKRISSDLHWGVPNLPCCLYVTKVASSILDCRIKEILEIWTAHKEYQQPKSAAPSFTGIFEEADDLSQSVSRPTSSFDANWPLSKWNETLYVSFDCSEVWKLHAFQLNSMDAVLKQDLSNPLWQKKEKRS